jgi:enterochelin esterase-like enzyme
MGWISISLVQILMIGILPAGASFAGDAPSKAAHFTKVSIVNAAGLADPVTGRVFVIISRDKNTEPRLIMASYLGTSSHYAPFFAKDIESLRRGATATINEVDVGFPLHSMQDIRAGDYTVQALLNVYTEFTRADGHTIWAHKDQGEGQNLQIAPGNLVSDPMRVHLDPQQGFSLTLRLTRVLGPIPTENDTQYIKHVRFKSKLASAFWGKDMYVAATVVLPKGYDEHTDVHYPVIFDHGHYRERVPFHFDEVNAHEGQDDARDLQTSVKVFSEAWRSNHFPRMILVSLQHPTPFYDDSYFVNSPNTGPWDDVFMKEVIPFLEQRFRIIRRPYARVLAGISSGGWIAAALQIHHPNQFGGAWVSAPDVLDFRDYIDGINLYFDNSAWYAPSNSGWPEFAPERPMLRAVNGQPLMTMRQFSQLSLALGSHGRSGGWFDSQNAHWGPVGTDGYPLEVFDYRTGTINHDVAKYWREHDYDLRDYLSRHWTTIGPQLKDKLHFSCGDMDIFYMNISMRRMESFLQHVQNPVFSGDIKWGRPMIGHTWIGVGYDPWPTKMLQDIAANIVQHAAADDDSSRWHYN